MVFELREHHDEHPLLLPAHHPQQNRFPSHVHLDLWALIIGLVNSFIVLGASPSSTALYVRRWRRLRLRRAAAAAGEVVVLLLLLQRLEPVLEVVHVLDGAAQDGHLVGLRME